MENNLEVGEPLVQAKENFTIPEKPSRVKKPTMDISIQPNSIVVPPRGIMVGTGSREHKYELWLEREVNAAIGVFHQLNIQGSITQASRKRFGLLQSLCYMAVAEEEVEVLCYVFKGDKSRMGFDILGTLRGFVKKNHEILVEFAPYLDVTRDLANPQK